MFSPIAPIASAHAVASSCSRSSSTENVMASASTSTHADEHLLRRGVQQGHVLRCRTCTAPAGRTGSRIGSTVISAIHLSGAEQPVRPHQQHHQHHQVRRDQGERRRPARARCPLVGGDQRLDHADRQPADHRAAQRVQAAEDDHRQRLQRDDPQLLVDPGAGRHEHAGDRGERAGDRPRQREHRADRDPLGQRRLLVERRPPASPGPCGCSGRTRTARRPAPSW